MLAAFLMLLTANLLINKTNIPFKKNRVLTHEKLGYMKPVSFINYLIRTCAYLLSSL